MQKSSDLHSVWVPKYLLPKLINIFKKKCNSEDVKYSISTPDSFFMSDLFFINIEFSDGEAKKLVIKVPPQNEQTKAYQDISTFTNEMTVYKTMGPHFNQDFPRCFYAGESEGSINYLIILENVSDRGYFTCPQKINLSMDYTLAAMQSLGKFHAYGYYLKEKKPKEFLEITNSLKEVRFFEKNHAFAEFINKPTRDVVTLFVEKSNDENLNTKLIKLFTNAFENVMVKCVVPREPLSTICHGDYVRNNLLFKKQDERISAMMIDFGYSVHSSPVLDISSFMYMSVSIEDIKYRFDEIFKAYHDSLTQNLIENNVSCEKYSYEALYEEYKRCSIYGFVIATFFLEIMYEYEEDPNFLKNGVGQVCEVPLKDKKKFSNVLIDMLSDMKDKGLLDSYIENYL